jgi:hypothetical protein
LKKQSRTCSKVHEPREDPSCAEAGRVFLTSEWFTRYGVKVFDCGPLNSCVGAYDVANDNDISPEIAMAIDQIIAEGSYGEIIAKWNLESDASGSAGVHR